MYDCLTLEMDDSGIIEWHVDASFAVHSDMRSHTGATLFMGKGAIESVSSKQKMNARSSTDAEIVAADDIASRAMWTKLFLEEQGHKINRNIVYQDNKSSILLMKNGRSSAGKRTRHMKIKYFYATDAHNQGDLEMQCCSTNDMTADYMTKALQGTKCKLMRCKIMNVAANKNEAENKLTMAPATVFWRKTEKLRFIQFFQNGTGITTRFSRSKNMQ